MGALPLSCEFSVSASYYNKMPRNNFFFTYLLKFSITFPYYPFETRHKNVLNTACTVSLIHVTYFFFSKLE